VSGPEVASSLAGSGVVVYAARARARIRSGARARIRSGVRGRARSDARPDGPPVDLDDAREVFEAAAAAGARLIVLSSTEIQAPHHHNLGLLSEDRLQPQLQTRSGGNPISDAWLALEELAGQVAAEAGTELVILRAAPSPVPGGDDFWSRLLSGSVARLPPGRDPPLQLLAIDDLARGIGLAADFRVDAARAAVFHLVPDGAVPLRRALRLAGVRRLPLPRSGARAEFLTHPWTAAGERAAAELGFRPAASASDVAAGMGEGVSVPPIPEWEWGRSEPDPFGMDPEYIARYDRHLFRFLHDLWWRVEHRGVEHVPEEGAGVLTGVHRGFMPYDGVMALHLLVRERGRYPRFLIHPTLVKQPFLADFMTRLGGVPACRENADWVLSRGGLVGVFPEGIRGAFTPYRRAYKLGKFGRDEYVRMALRNRVPIYPFVTVGSAEIFPIVGRIDWKWWKRVSEWPYLPIAPPFPLLPVPLPSKWHTRLLEPVHVEREHGPEAADDPRAVKAIGREVRRRMKAAIDGMLARRKSVFWGTVFEP
jgi:1-acyl-sn-glycerol-3-phosphate acyltransferase/nucleoside-diphosphate-sugar epimerase